jgi:REP element-mobilizing transposase RayT
MYRQTIVDYARVPIMPYDPNRHHRRSIRLPGYDYSQPGFYFVTIVTHERRCLFDNPALRAIAEQQWWALARPDRVVLDAWVVMPNHVHGIIAITDARSPSADPATIDNAVGAQQAHPLRDKTRSARARYRSRLDRSKTAPAAPLRTSDDGDVNHTGDAATPRGLGINVAPGSLGAVVRSYKSSVTKRIHRTRHAPAGLVWQRGYWERIVRDKRELEAIRRYIDNNPARWQADRENLDALLARMRVRP